MVSLTDTPKRALRARCASRTCRGVRGFRVSGLGFRRARCASRTCRGVRGFRVSGLGFRRARCASRTCRGVRGCRHVTHVTRYKVPCWMMGVMGYGCKGVHMLQSLRPLLVCIHGCTHVTVDTPVTPVTRYAHYRAKLYDSAALVRGRIGGDVENRDPCFENTALRRRGERQWGVSGGAVVEEEVVVVERNPMTRRRREEQSKMSRGGLLPRSTQISLCMFRVQGLGFKV